MANIIKSFEQGSPEWWAAKKNKISGTRFGQLISGRKNRLEYELANEYLMDVLLPDPDEWTSEEMQFGIDNEPIAVQKYLVKAGLDHLPRYKPGLIVSDFHPDWHCASPDYVVELPDSAGLIVIEVKCTMNGAIHMQRHVEGPESSYMPQIKNYFAVSDDVKEVHWVSYCPDRPERELVVRDFNRTEFAGQVQIWRDLVGAYADKTLEIVRVFSGF
jgi:hypothetical protein